MDVPGGDRRLTARRNAARVAALALALALAGCLMPVGRAEPEPAVQLGPTLIVDVANRSDAEREFGYEWSDGPGSGGGGGTLAACERMAIPLGEIRGDYSITIDGTSVLEGAVPPNAPAGGHLVVRVSIAPDGTATGQAPLFLARAPDPQPIPIEDCG